MNKYVPFLLSDKLSVDSLNEYLITPDKYVFPFEIKEPNKTRKIITYNSVENLGGRLRKLHEHIVHNFKNNIHDRNKHSFAYHKGISCLDALKDHMRSNIFIKLDIHHFFESITEENFLKFYGGRFNQNWKNILKYVFYKNSLSIGFVTSPVISDFYMSKFDNAIEEYIKNNPKLHYSRYSDDMLLSSEEDDDKSIEELFSFVKSELLKLNLEINSKKTKKVHLSYEKHNSISFLGLNLSKADEYDNKITISKNYILFLLYLIEKNERYQSKCRELVNEINSRVAYLAYNSPVSFNRFQKKFFNIYGKYYDFKPKEVNSRKVGAKADDIVEYESYTNKFQFQLHCKVINEFNGRVVVNDGVEITRYIGHDQIVEIPYFVNSIGSNAFAHNKSVKKVILNNSIAAIKDNAFMDTFIEEINLPKSVVYISRGAFTNSKLKKVNIPSNLMIIPGRCFENTPLEEIVFDEEGKLEIISESAFKNTHIKEIKLPNTLKTLSRSSFEDNKFLKTIIFSNQLTTIPSYCFKGLDRIEEITLPENILSLESYAFQSAFNLKKVNIPKNLVYINEFAFNGCHLLNEINIDTDNMVYYSVDSSIIERESNKIIFTNNFSTIDSNIEIIGEGVYENSPFEYIDLTNVKYIKAGAFKNSTLLKEVKFGNDLVSIGKGAFEGCISLESISIPDSVKVIEDSAFANCSLRNVKLSNQLEVLSYKVFFDNKLERIDLPDSVKVIEHNAFAKCSSLKELHFGKNIRRISQLAFVEAQKNLEKITIDPLNTKYMDYDSNIIVSRVHNDLVLGCKNSLIPLGVEKINKYAFAYISEIKEIIIPQSVKVIDKYAFANNHNLEKVQLDNVYYIGIGAFENCYNLKHINLPTSITTIKDNAFNNTNIEEINLPISIANIGTFAFANNKNLKKIFIPSHLDKFDRSWFDGCFNIESIIVDESNPYFDSRDNCNAICNSFDDTVLFACKNTIIPLSCKTLVPLCYVNHKVIEEIYLPDNINLLSDGTFQYYYSLKKIILPKNLDCIPSHCFSCCYSLEEINIPNSVITILDYAFKSCVSLKEITIPSNVSTLSHGVFKNCSNLSKVKYESIVENKNPFIPNEGKRMIIKENTFANCVKLESVMIPNEDVRVYIETSAFENCSSLKSLGFEDRITQISHNAFKNCVSLEFKFSKDIETIGYSAFENVNLLKNIILGDKLQKLYTNSFENCDLNHISISTSNPGGYISNNDGVYEINQGNKCLIIGTNNTIIDEDTVMIESGAFNSLNKLEEIVIPNNVKTIKKNAFGNCPNLKVVVNNSDIVSVDLINFYKCDSLVKIDNKPIYAIINSYNNYLLSFKLLSLVKINGIKVLNESIDEVIIDKNINEVIINQPISIYKSIIVDKENMNYTDLGSNNLLVDKKGKLIAAVINPILKEGINYIDYKTIEINKNIDEFIIPNGVKYISNFAIYGTGSIKRLFIPSTVEYISESFTDISVENIEVDKNNPFYKSINNNLIKKSNNELVKLATNALINEDIKTIGNSPFIDNKNIDKIYIPRFIKDLTWLSSVKSYNIIEVSNKHPYLIVDNNCLIDKRNNTLLLSGKNSIVPNYIKRYGKNSILLDDEETTISIGENVSYLHKDWIRKDHNLDKVYVNINNKTFYSAEDNKVICLKNDDYEIFKTKGYEVELSKHLKMCSKHSYKLEIYTGKKKILEEQYFDDTPFKNDVPFNESNVEDDDLPF